MKKIMFQYESKPSSFAPFIRQGVSREAVKNFITSASEKKVDIHSFQIWHDNELVLRASLPPYDCTDKRQYYSLSKAFVSTAFGLAYDRGLLSPDMRIAEFFSDKLPENVSDNLKKSTFSNVLSMNSGVDNENFHRMVPSDDPARTFLSAEFKYEPGTHFFYDTGATCFLAAAVEKASGMSLMEFLWRNLFRYIGINGVYWTRTKAGTVQGGIGLHASCDDAAKLGLLYLNGGEWNGKQLLSKEWIDRATRSHSDNWSQDKKEKGSSDWNSGYAYQFWCNARGGYRGDGAFGQFSIVLPEKNMVLACMAEAINTQDEVNALIDLADHIFDSDKEECDIENFLADHYAPKAGDKLPSGLDRMWDMSDDKVTMKMRMVSEEGDDLLLTFCAKDRLVPVRCGNGKWVHNAASVSDIYEMKNDLMYPAGVTGAMAACYRLDGDELTVSMRNLSAPNRNDLVMNFDKNEAEYRGIGYFTGKIDEVFKIKMIEIE